jgi:molybdopterin-containing oxidoreductase family iron-sulfur binding subunit
MSRLYAIESTPTSTGAKADHRLPAKAVEIGILTGDLAHFLATREMIPIANVAGGEYANFLTAAGRDLLSHRGAGLVMAGEHQPPVVHGMAHALNADL